MGNTVGIVSLSWKYIAILQNEFIYGGHLTSLGSPILIVCVAMLLNISVNIPVLLIAYLIPLIVYSLNYYSELEKDAESNPERFMLIRKKRRSYPLIIGGYVLTLLALILVYANFGLMSFIAFLALSGMFYTIVFKELVKNMPGSKSVYTSFVWASGGAFFLAFYDLSGISLAYVFIFLFMFMKSLVNVIFFDIKDIETDRSRGIKTIPVVLGKERTLRFLQAMNALAFVPLLAGVIIGSLPAFALSLLALYAYTFAYLKKAEGLEGREIRLASYTLAEAEIVLWPILLLVGKAAYNAL